MTKSTWTLLALAAVAALVWWWAKHRKPKLAYVPGGMADPNTPAVKNTAGATQADGPLGQSDVTFTDNEAGDPLAEG